MNARTITFGCDGLSFEGELVSDAEPAAVVVLCHGIPGGGARDPRDGGYADLARTVAGYGYGAFWFDFRGVRSSPGDFSIAGWGRDLSAALDALATDRVTAGKPVVLAGSSAGGAVSIATAALRPDVAAVATLAAPATYGFAGEAPDRLLARLQNAGMIRDPNFPPDVAAWAAELDDAAAERHIVAIAPRPLLIVHGDADDVVPYGHAERLFAAAHPPKELARIPNGRHQLRRDERAVMCLMDWLNRTIS